MLEVRGKISWNVDNLAILARNGYKTSERWNILHHLWLMSDEISSGIGTRTDTSRPSHRRWRRRLKVSRSWPFRVTWVTWHIIDHVTIRLTIGHWWSFGTMPLSLTVSEIFSGTMVDVDMTLKRPLGSKQSSISVYVYHSVELDR